MEKTQTATSTIYIRLLEEAITCIRPTQAEVLEDGTYRVLPTPEYDPTDEVWEFVPGSRVHCEMFDDPKGAYLLAVAEAGVDRNRNGRGALAALQDAIEYRDANGICYGISKPRTSCLSGNTRRTKVRLETIGS